MRRCARGFTLVELMTVVVVLGIVTVLAAPSFSRTLADRHVRGAAEEAYADLQYARSESVQRNAAVSLTFNATGWQVTAAGGAVLKTVVLGKPSLSTGIGTLVVFSPTRATAAVTGAAPTFAAAGTTATLRVTTGLLGRSELCSPSGTMTGYAAC